MRVLPFILSLAVVIVSTEVFASPMLQQPSSANITLSFMKLMVSLEWAGKVVDAEASALNGMSLEVDTHIFPKQYATPAWDKKFAGRDYSALPADVDADILAFQGDEYYIDVFNYKKPSLLQWPLVFAKTVWSACPKYFGLSTEMSLEVFASLASLTTGAEYNSDAVEQTVYLLLKSVGIVGASAVYFGSFDEDPEANFSVGILSLPKLNEIKKIQFSLPIAPGTCGTGYALLKLELHPKTCLKGLYACPYTIGGPTCGPKESRDQAKGCLSSPNAAGCNDGNACTQSDTCTLGVCQEQTATCNDGNPCTVDSCDQLKGCVFTATIGACDADGKACTADSCIAGKCQVGQTSGENCCNGIDDDCDGETDECGIPLVLQYGAPVADKALKLVYQASP